MKLSANIRFYLLLVASFILVAALINYCIVASNEAESEGIYKRKATVVGTTTTCHTDYKSSTHYLRYTYNYKGKKYTDGYYFSRKKPDKEICKGARFLVILDSAKPRNNYLLIDSMISN
ncbi:hypothetical protein HHL16_19325 [Pseudoflavitalea sp. G-6-1-2]|uniref:hypothetical protein n=1 Tax=Pseudoflavitalea sp. G-6-1-2 TaxID=2728841 RepID=UPI00146E644D|nr:hypothetical protein [Pseudoflavitalea sp. G-6-1-2]NML23038.1 hypothetical protein [Pseudoflavitalea sp. G-6-1-2]